MDGRDVFPRNIKYHIPVFMIIVTTLGNNYVRNIINSNYYTEFVLFLVSAIQLAETCQEVSWQVECISSILS